MGFDWEHPADVLDKIQEELDEVRRALKAEEWGNVAEETGDLFFALINFHRLLNISSLQVFHNGVSKFERRFEALQAKIRETGENIQDLSPDALNEIWEAVKRGEKHEC